VFPDGKRRTHLSVILAPPSEGEGKSKSKADDDGTEHVKGYVRTEAAPEI